MVLILGCWDRGCSPSSELDVTPEVLTDPLSNTCIIGQRKKYNLTMVHRIRMIEDKRFISVTQDIGDFLSPGHIGMAT